MPATGATRCVVSLNRSAGAPARSAATTWATARADRRWARACYLFSDAQRLARRVGETAAADPAFADAVGLPKPLRVLRQLKRAASGFQIEAYDPGNLGRAA